MEIGDFLKDLSARLTDILPPALKTIKSDCEKNMHSVLVSVRAADTRLAECKMITKKK
jgi:hypothetical protein